MCVYLKTTLGACIEILPHAESRWIQSVAPEHGEKYRPSRQRERERERERPDMSRCCMEPRWCG